MFSAFGPVVSVVLAVLDYLVKAAINYRDTDEGRAEWNDIEAALGELGGDEQATADARANAAVNRMNVAVGRQGDRQEPASRAFKPLTED